MSGMLNQEELVKKFDGAFKDANARTFGVVFPDGSKSVMRPLTPRQYKQFMGVIDGSIKGFALIGMTDFETKSGEKFKGRELIPTNEDGSPKELPNIRIELLDGDIKEIPREGVVKQDKPDNQEYMKRVEKLLWDNGDKLLHILFPEKEFTPEYLDTTMHVPFLRTVWDLAVELNGLEDIIPFVKKMLFEDIDVKKKK